jgi:hypothetical protein
MHRHWRIIMVLAKAKAESRPRRSEEGARQKRRKERVFLAGGNLKFEIFNAPTPVALCGIVCMVGYPFNRPIQEYLQVRGEGGRTKPAPAGTI